jgi:hypothetical protein
MGFLVVGGAVHITATATETPGNLLKDTFFPMSGLVVKTYGLRKDMEVLFVWCGIGFLWWALSHAPPLDE